MIRNESNEGSDAADHFLSTDRRLVDDSVHRHKKDRHGGDNRSDLILGSKIEGPVENELGHGHPENREGDHQKRFFKDRLQQISRFFLNQGDYQQCRASDGETSDRNLRSFQTRVDGKEFTGCMTKYSEKGSRVSPKGKAAFQLRFGHQGFWDFAKSRSTSENSGPHSAGSIWAASGISTF